mgnify:CR=1 FL=1
MGKFTIILSSAIFLTLIACLAQSVDADHLEPGDAVFRNIGEANIVTSHGSNYQTYLQVVLRNSDGQLISVTDSSGTAAYIPHQITDHAFDTLMGKKEIITIDNIKYEKIQYIGTLDIEQLLPPSKKPSHFIGNWVINLCKVFDKHGYTCIAPWQANSSFVSLEEDNVVKNHWTILRAID